MLCITFFCTLTYEQVGKIQNKKEKKLNINIYRKLTQNYILTKKERNTPPYLLMKKLVKINKKWGNGERIVCSSDLYLLHFILWVSNLLFDLAIIVSIKKTALILRELRTLMEGEYLFCVQEYRYCFASYKMIHKYLVLTSNNTKQYIFVCKIFNLDLVINKPFYNLRPEILIIMTRQEKMFEGFIRFTT